MLVLKLGMLLLLLGVCVFSPGFFFVRRFRWTPLEKLCASIGTSLIFLYLASAVIYGLGLNWSVCCWCVSGVCAALLAIAAADFRQLTADPSVRSGLYGFGFLLLWTLLILAMIRNYSGGGWSTDWLEHFQRVLYFLHRFPKASPLVEGYAVPARPPMMNLLGAFFLAQTSDRFECFQLAFAFLNLLVFLPCYLIAPAVAFRGRRRVAPLVALFAASPVVMQNTSYPWTKLLAVFYVILALWFYLRGWRKGSTSRMTAAFAFLAAGMLVHYSTGPYFLFLGLHYILFVFWKRPDKWRELAAVAGAGGLLLATWLVWSLAAYGVHSTVASNTSVTPSQHVEGGNLAKIAANFFDTVVPHPLRSDASTGILQQPSAIGYFRDYFFLLYQTNAIFGIGLLAGPIALYLLYQGWRRKKGPWRFWFALIAFCLVVGVAVHGERETFGVAHVTLQPLLLLGLCLLAGSFATMPRALGWIVVVGCAIDFAVGVTPQVIVENMENTASETVFAGLAISNGRITIGQPEFLSHRAWLNWFGKHQIAAAGQWLQQTPQSLGQLRTALENSRAQDAVLWHGWYSRHGGEMTFLGDWVGGIALPLAAWMALFLAIMAALVRQIPKALKPIAAPGVKPKKRRAGR